MKLPGSARAALLAAAVVAEVAGLGLAVLPAVAQTRHHGGGAQDLKLARLAVRPGDEVLKLPGVRPASRPSAAGTPAPWS